MDSKKTQLLKKAFDDYINLMLYDFPLDRIKEIVADDITGYGTTIDEKVLDIDKIKKIVTDQREQGNGIDMQIKSIPVHRRISPDEDNALYMDEFEVSMLVDGTQNMIPLRLTSVFEFNDNNWKLVHLHGSKAVETEEDTWHLNEWKQKSEQLQKLVDEKTAELTKQNRELEIEAALEKIRSRSLAMHKSDELQEIVNIVFEKLVELKVETDVVSVIILNENLDEMEYWVANSKQINSVMYRIIHNDDILILKDVMISRKSGLDFSKDYTFEEKNQLWEYLYLHSDFKNTPDERKKFVLNTPAYTTAVSFTKNTAVQLNRYYKKSFTDDERDILKRITKVFEQTYIRFLDLQKAEAQAREAEIQLALERVRSRTMAMHKSEELSEVVKLLYSQIEPFGVSTFGISIAIFRKEENAIEYWFADHLDSNLLQSYKMVGQKNKVFRQNWEDWRNKTPQTQVYMEGQEKRDFDTYILEESDFRKLPEELKRNIRTHKTVCFTFTFFKYGYFESVDLTIPDEENTNVLIRFAKVFEQTYTRFLDLQKAEAQARESQIQLALERVRARTMAMQRSEELADVALVLFQQVKQLGIETWSTGFNVWLEGETSYIDWVVSTAEGRFIEPYTVDLTAHPFILEISKAKKRGDDFFMIEAEGETLAETYRLLFKMAKIQIENLLNAGFQMPEHQINHYVFGKQVSLMFITSDPCPEAHDIFKRLGKAFEQTYTRFLDLQKAEAQARESQIQLALERVRASAMAMQKSEELAQAANLLFHQMQALDIPAFSAGYCIWADEKQAATFWMSSEGVLQPPFKVPLTENSMFIHYREAYLRGESFYAEEFGGEELEKHYQYMCTIPDIIDMLEEANEAGIQILAFPTFQINHVVYFSSGFLLFVTYQQVPEAHDIFKRFGKVFEQTYTRFLDLQKAEAQAREAQIEAALEKVRSRSLAMHSTSELGEVVTVIVEKLTELGVVLDANGVVLCTYFEDSKDVLHWIVSPDFKMAGSYLLPWFDHLIFREAWESKESGDAYFSKAYSVEDKNSFFEYAFEHSDYRYFPEDFKQWVFQNDKHILSFAWQKNSAILIPSHTGVVPTEDEAAILKRFAKVFEQAYTRFLDLQKAEAQAREAIKQASLDRVRGEIASMRTKDDLNRITPLIWKELNALGVPFIRCGVFIMNEEKRVIQTYLSTPDGKSLTAFEMAYDSERVAAGAVFHWNKKEIYQDHWDKKQFVDFMQNLVKTGQIKNAESFQGTSAPPESLDLHFLPFKQGMLYVGNNSPLAREELQLVQSLADSFSIAYARYEDFRQLEEAKNQIEKTFTELKAAQAQLIQAEKMASLGELTAGIAHEIQNPLNFVNNFSELSKELIVEMNEELAVGTDASVHLAREIAGDIEQNLDKINHHGKRAADIVKGMLQHSRKSSGQKEPTDINALADEYLRLAYHGLRAKDKSLPDGQAGFNAEFKTDFDPNLPKINVIPQDIGRVLLNLINNAFYAVDKQSKEEYPLTPPEKIGINAGEMKNDQTQYRPTVTVSTTSSKSPSGDSRLNDTVGQVGVRIIVKDNGNGIPKHIVDKIFQPFFTTKPTGQGTGLGLSLSYDIVKAHGGELKVETVEGRGTEFIIHLPI